MAKTYKRLRLILGDQLNPRHSWYREKDADTLYVIAELHQETGYTRHHVQKICAFFAAMAAFAQALGKAGHEVLHLNLDDTRADATLPELLTRLIAKYGVSCFEYQLPDEYRLRTQLADFASAVPVTTSAWETEHFYLSDQELAHYFQPGKRHQMEAFYRKLRVRFDILMDGAAPQGGQWNFDADNRNKLKAAELDQIPEPLLFANEVGSILERLGRHNVDTMGKPITPLPWPVNRQQAIALLEHFCRHALPQFGRYQDAMTGKLDVSDRARQWTLFHSRLSFALNCKMLDPRQVIRVAIEHYQADPRKERIGVAQIEGFVRQILGWREFVRGLYWANMPDYAQLNALAAQRALPSWFWDAKTRMNCQKQAISQSLEFAYAHHIQRLMITGNFCLLTGIDPDEVDQWYLGIYIDAIEWVELPNTRGMSQFADGGIVGSKAYAASGNYVQKMSDYCSDCTYQVKQVTGADACPLNSLYWRFMQQHERDFATNPRNKMVYANWQKKPLAQREAILARAEQLLDDLESL
ncbi:cryptochrome/photolyase family protein [Halopseudomonas sabulinigri]|uniref:Cryptochrome/photolyase family protein n=1 Tax=Halopseudomonas sabulinigri TaxID=472181 RepID=A0ABP9ZSD4_9GAMM